MFLRYSAELEPSAVAFLDTCGDDEARRVRVLVDQIRDSPTIDEREVFALFIPPAVFHVLVKDGYWIAFLVRSFELWIVAIARGDDLPSATELRDAQRSP